MRKIYITYPETKTDLQLFCRESVEKHQPEWEIVEILSPYLVNDWPLANQYFKPDQLEIVQCDLVRLEAIWNTGGIYLDSDIYLLQPIDCVLDDKLPTFWNNNPHPEVAMSWLNGMFSAPPKHPLILDLLHASGRGAAKCSPNSPTACLQAYSSHLRSIEQVGFNRLGPDEVVFSSFIKYVVADSYQEIVDRIVDAREKLPLAIHLTQHSWDTLHLTQPYYI